MSGDKTQTSQDFVALAKGIKTQLGELNTRTRGLDAKLTNIEKNAVSRSDFRRVEEKITKMERSLKRRMGKHRNEVLKAIGDLAMTTPTQNEFDELNARVERYHPVS